MALIAQGLDNKEIGAALFIGLNTVKTYERTAYRDWCGSRSEAVGWAVLNGFALTETPPTPQP